MVQLNVKIVIPQQYCTCMCNLVWLIHVFQVFQDPSAMLQHLLTTQRPLTLGAYKHENDCEYDATLHNIIMYNNKTTKPSIARKSMEIGAQR